MKRHRYFIGFATATMKAIPGRGVIPQQGYSNATFEVDEPLKNGHQINSIAQVMSRLVEGQCTVINITYLGEFEPASEGEGVVALMERSEEDLAAEEAEEKAKAEKKDKHGWRSRKKKASE